MINFQKIDESETHKVSKITIPGFEKTEYSYNKDNDKIIFVSNGSGIVTINTVDFRISKKSSVLIEKDKEYLIANTLEKEDLILVEIEIF